MQQKSSPRNLQRKAKFVLLITTCSAAIYFLTKSRSKDLEISKTDIINSCSRFPLELDIKELQKFSLEDESLLDYIRCHHLIPPSSLDYPPSVKVSNPSEFAGEIKLLFGDKRNGFFIECGANDGEFLSNTLVLERDYGWTGLLIEASPEMRPKLLSKNRKAWFINACLSPHPNISEIEFYRSDRVDKNRAWLDGIGRVFMPDDVDIVHHKNDNQYKLKPIGIVRCFPLATILKAMHISQVNYFSLDVEGVEFKILKTLPFDKSLMIDVIQAEHKHVPENKTLFTKYMEAKGYKTVLDAKSNYIFQQDSLRNPFIPNK